VGAAGVGECVRVEIPVNVTARVGETLADGDTRRAGVRQAERARVRTRNIPSPGSSISGVLPLFVRIESLTWCRSEKFPWQKPSTNRRLHTSRAATYQPGGYIPAGRLKTNRHEYANSAIREFVYVRGWLFSF
jgi:hypothetical protein